MKSYLTSLLQRSDLEALLILVIVTRVALFDVLPWSLVAALALVIVSRGVANALDKRLAIQQAKDQDAIKRLDDEVKKLMLVNNAKSLSR